MTLFYPIPGRYAVCSGEQIMGFDDLDEALDCLENYFDGKGNILDRDTQIVVKQGGRND